MSEKKKYWIITPHLRSDCDNAALPAETEEDHRKALDYAQHVLEMQWDDMNLDKDDHPDTIPNVSMEIVWLAPGELLNEDD
jgi:hypothetical protein